MTTDNDKAPEWMTEEWLRDHFDHPHSVPPRAVSMACREILRLRAELAKRTAFIASLPNLKEAGEMCKQAAAELATLTAELATLKAHADHDAGEILRLGGELADIKACDGPIAQAEAYGESMRHENDGLRAEIAAAQMILPMSTGTLADSARTLRTERENARAERNKAEAERDAARAERDALHKSYVAAVDERDAALACKGCGGTVSHHLAPDQGGCPGRFVIDGVPMVPVAHVEAARAEVERLNHLADAGKMAMGNVISALNEAGRTRGSEVERIRDLACERDAAIRDRNEFAASEVERVHADWLRLVADRGAWACGTVDAFFAARAAELRQAAGAELCGGCGATSAKDAEAKCRPDGDSCPGVDLWGRKAAGAAAPVEPSIAALIQGAEDAAVEWGKCVGDYHAACRVAPPPSPRDVSDAVRESGRKCEHAWDVLRKAIRAIAADLHQSTPAADARQPAGDSTRCRMIAQTIIAAIGSAGPENVEQSVDRLLRHLSETEKREADGIKLFDDLLATERAKVATMSIELDGMRNRIAASEKAKVDQVVLVMNLRRALGMVRAKVGRVLGPQWEDNGHVGQVIRAAVELCAERAGGAS